MLKFEKHMAYTKKTSRYLVLLGIAFLAALGCDKSASKQDAVVQGTVTIDGELVGQGIVTFHPVGDGPVAYGTILKDGTYALRVGKGQKQDRNNKILPGRYIATVAVTMTSSALQGDGSDVDIRKPGPRLSDAKFSNRTTSELRYDVTSGRNIINISVERALPEEENSERSVAEEGVAVDGNSSPREDQPQAGEQDTVEQETENAGDSQKTPPLDEGASSGVVKEEPAQ